MKHSGYESCTEGGELHGMIRPTDACVFNQLPLHGAASHFLWTIWSQWYCCMFCQTPVAVSQRLGPLSMTSLALQSWS